MNPTPRRPPAPLPAGRPRPFRPAAEALEDRLVPTVAFNPHYGSVNAVGPSDDPLGSPPIFELFYGSYWASQQGRADKADLIAATKSIATGPYLSATTQYGTDGKATWGADWTVVSDPKHQFDIYDLGDVVVKAIDDQSSPIPRPSTPAHDPIYLVVTDPYAVPEHPTWRGDHANTGYPYPSGTIFGGYIWGAEVTAWAPTRFSGAAVDRDEFTRIASRVLAETVTHPYLEGTTLDYPAALPWQMYGDRGIGQGEAEALRYSYRLNGYDVQPYWSNRDNAYVVPDGNRQTFVANPVFQPNPVTGATTFAGRYDLNVSGDQLGVNYADAMAVDQNANTSSGTRVTANGESVDFRPGLIRKATVDTKGGVNTVAVHAVESGTQVFVTSFSGRDQVTVGANGSLSAILGTVDVSNSSGQTTLAVDDSKDAGTRRVAVTDRAVQFDGVGRITYTGSHLTSTGQPVGVTRLNVFAGPGRVSVDVQSVNPDTATTLWFKSGGIPVVGGAAAGKVGKIVY